MTEYKTLRVPVEAWETAKAQKEEAGITWGEQIVREDDSDDTDLDSLSRSVATIEERTGKLERMLEGMQR